MTRLEKLAAEAELSALKNAIPTTADLWSLAEWMFMVKKAFHQYLPQNNLPEVIAGLFYVVNKGKLEIVSHAAYANGIKSAERLMGSVISDLKATRDIVDV